MSEQDKTEATARKIVVTDAEPPALVRAETEQWKMVTIPLTDDQIGQLKEHGVDISEISIRTFDLGRLAMLPPN